MRARTTRAVHWSVPPLSGGKAKEKKREGSQDDEEKEDPLMPWRSPCTKGKVHQAKKKTDQAAGGPFS